MSGDNDAFQIPATGYSQTLWSMPFTYLVLTNDKVLVSGEKKGTAHNTSYRSVPGLQFKRKINFIEIRRMAQDTAARA